MSEARYPYVHVDVTSEEAELVAASLFELGASGIEERDASTLARQEGASAITLVASFADEGSAEAALRELGAYRARLEYVVGDAWRDGWRAFWKPLRVGEHLVIVPSWEVFEASPNDLVLSLDPGQAFGTGTHESTQLLLRELERRVTSGVALLDIGCGSGILAIAALRLGAARALVLDTDPLAVDAARENAERNGVAAQLVASAEPVEHVSERFPLVLANIEARVLEPLAPVIAARVAPSGLLMLSGLLAGDVARVREAYAGFHELARPEQGEWRALVLRAPRESSA